MNNEGMKKIISLESFYVGQEKGEGKKEAEKERLEREERRCFVKERNLWFRDLILYLDQERKFSSLILCPL